MTQTLQNTESCSATFAGNDAFDYDGTQFIQKIFHDSSGKYQKTFVVNKSYGNARVKIIKYQLKSPKHNQKIGKTNLIITFEILNRLINHSIELMFISDNSDGEITECSAIEKDTNYVSYENLKGRIAYCCLGTSSAPNHPKASGDGGVESITDILGTSTGDCALQVPILLPTKISTVPPVVPTPAPGEHALYQRIAIAAVKQDGMPYVGISVDLDISDFDNDISEKITNGTHESIIQGELFVYLNETHSSYNVLPVVKISSAGMHYSVVEETVTRSCFAKWVKE